MRLLQLTVAAAVAATTPEHTWRPISYALADLTRRLSPQRRALPAGLPYLPTQVRSIQTQFSAGHLLESIQVMAHYRPWQWRVRVRLVGMRHLEAALQKSAGAILWVAPFHSSNIVVKLALDLAGHPLIHLSRPSHPFTRTWFGVHFLNRVQQKVEDLYLRERVLLSEASATGGLRALRRALSDNEVVSITLGDAATEVIEAPFLGARLRVATGPARLAATTGAPLLLVVTTRNDDGSYTVRIEPPPNDGGRDAESMVLAHCGTLEKFVHERPGQWVGWHLMRGA